MTAKNMKAKIKRYLFYFVIAFIVVFALRFIYVLYTDRHYVFVNFGAAQSQQYYVYDAPSGRGSSGVKNVASAKISQTDISTGKNITIDQKYEKIADIAASSPNFAEDNQNLREVIRQYNAVIQAETLDGLEGRQTLTMAIGVMPDNFDALVAAVKNIGNLRGFTVNKIDKTDDFRKLMAEQETLVKSREAYEAIKAKGGDIRDLLMLEDKILEIEAKMQNLGVNLGTYSSENSFCTVNFSLATELPQNTRAYISKRMLFESFAGSFIWTVVFFIVAALIVVFFMICALVITLIALKFKKLLPQNAAQLNEAEAESQTKNESK